MLESSAVVEAVVDDKEELLLVPEGEAVVVVVRSTVVVVIVVSEVAVAVVVVVCCPRFSSLFLLANDGLNEKVTLNNPIPPFPASKKKDDVFLSSANDDTAFGHSSFPDDDGQSEN